MENSTKKLPHGVLSRAANKLGFTPGYVWQVVHGSLKECQNASKVLATIKECIEEASQEKAKVREQREALLKEYAN